MADERRFSLEEIKAAYWKQFHESGELWFGYLGTPEQNVHYTDAYWQDFVCHLNDPTLLKAERD